MADLKISQLTAGDPAQTNDEIPIARSGANYKLTAGSISALPPTTAGANQVIYVDSAGTSLDGDSTFVYTAATGRLGIGTTSPSYSLQVENSLATQLYLRGAGAGYTQTSILLASSTATLPETRGLGTYMFNEGTDNTFYMGTFYNGSNTWGIGLAAGATFQTSAADVTNAKFVVTSTGNVGIGSTSPSYKLTTNYTAPATFTNAVGDFNQMWQASGTNALGVALSTGDTTARFVVNNGYAFAWNNAASEFMRLTSAGNLGVGTTSPVFKLVVSNAGAQGFEFDPSVGLMQVYNRSTSSYGEFRPYASLMRFFTGSSPTETMRLDSSGRLLLGTTTSITSWTSGRAMDLQIATISSNYPGLSAYSYSSSGAAGGMLIIGRSRGAFGVLSTTNSGDALGYLSFEGVNTANTAVAGAYIKGAQDGAAGAANIPGRIEFYVSTGSADPQERMRLDASGNLAIGTSTARGDLDVSSGNTPTSVTKSIHLGYSAANFYGFRLANTNAAGSFAAGTFSIQRGTTAAWNDDFVINDSGNVGIGTASPQAKLHVAAGNIVIDNNWGIAAFNNAATQESILSITTANNVNVSAPTLSGSLDFNIRNSTGSHRFFSGGTERARIDSSGRLLVGGTSAIVGASNGSIEVQNTAQEQFSLARFTNGSGAPTAYFNKSRGATVGTNTIVNDGDFLGIFSFRGANGTGYSEAASILAAVDGTPGASNDMPGRLIFATAADGTAGAAERMRITSDGRLLVGSTGVGLTATSGSIEVANAPGILYGAAAYAASTSAATFAFAKSRGASVGTNTIVVDGDVLGNIQFRGANGSGFDQAAIIRGEVDGTPGASNDMPGRLTFWTSADGSATPTERMRISNAGNVVVNTAAVATTATDGFLYIPTCAGAPTGVPTTFTGRSPLVVDSTNNRFYVYVNGAWKYATLT